MRASLKSTSTRTFVALPAVVAAEQVVSRRRLHLGWSPLLAAGFLTYRAAGRYRLPRAGGPPGMSQGMPEELVTSGPYRYVRNPMYLGHLVFMSGLTLTSRSPVAAAALAGHLRWFHSRVRRDEERLRQRFGPAYDEYCSRVPRWVPLDPIRLWRRRTAEPTLREDPGRPR